ncbi:MAG: SprB repeat-containing protein [Bacteroidota bacterium]|nr:SprB repeat-containing protein [Bacteroidota bacterium]MDQ3534654.1 SprB repeat-containing protein [Bacteroidota bacterium]
MNGCLFTHPDVQRITLPPAVLEFAATLSNYNGFNISCFGGSNGTATITASGGNGGDYSGYGYALDKGPFQDEATLSGIYAGTHTITVRDKRGCVVEKTFTFSQTAERMAAELLKKQDLLCFGGTTGILEVKGSGGLGPYQYSIDGLSFLPQGRFENLPAGSHTITIKDKNDCGAGFVYELLHLNTPISISKQVTQVSCFGGNDGAITTQVSGGAPPYQYLWKEPNSTSSVVSGLSKGTYTLI